ncbi:hypothetical protein [Paraburkholderia sp.]|uniref:hypothetical protein n=1 Tax=Paraburkholderia sp. TaxID=1926495 RepID=UPI002D58D575|nr:hypothetical protein [Paraburkholderia sp.]HZZ03341.1 hypothetical protein [Paraburkholderia sp.]
MRPSLIPEGQLAMHWLDPDHLPETSGHLDRFLLNPHGDVDGMILTDGTEVHVPPHLSDAMCATVHPGDAIRVRGVRPRAADMIAAVAIETADGTRIVDNGPPVHHKKKKPIPEHIANAGRHPMQADGIVQRVLHGPKGEVRRALLEDGRIVRWPPHETDAIAGLLVPGSTLAIRGEGLVTGFGTVIEVQEIGASAATARAINDKKPGKSKKPEKGEKPKKPSHDNAQEPAHEQGDTVD